MTNEKSKAESNRIDGYIWDVKNIRLLAYFLKPEYEANGMWPEEGIDVALSVSDEYTGQPPDGKVLGAGVDGMPAWVDAPPPSQDELVKQATAEKAARINQANAYINDRQWPGKAVLGRLDANEMKMYNVWLDYLEKLEAVDPSTASNIIFPDKPC